MAEKLYMMFDDEREPLGLVLVTEQGRFVRSDENWFTLPASNMRFEGAEIIEVEEDFVKFYDKLDTKGKNPPTFNQTEAYEIEDEEE